MALGGPVMEADLFRVLSMPMSMSMSMSALFTDALTRSVCSVDARFNPCGGDTKFSFSDGILLLEVISAVAERGREGECLRASGFTGDGWSALHRRKKQGECTYDV